MRQVLILLICSLLASLDVAGQIIIDGTPVAFDRLSNTYLVTIPAHQWGKDWQAQVTLEDSTDWQQVEVNGQPVGQTVTFDQVEPQKTYSVRAMLGDSLLHRQLEFTYLPIVHLWGEFGIEQAPARITLQMPGEGEQELKAMVKWRGYTTNDSAKHKRNYKSNFVDKEGEKKD